jgi:HEAT repeat protein
VLDELDRKLAQAAAKNGIVPAKQLGELSQRAEAGGTSLARVLIDENREGTLALLRSLHAGFPAHEEDALDRHEDRLIARLALRVGALDDATARAAVTEQEQRRAQGERKRLGEILVETGKVDAATAERLYRQFENAAIVCPDCFAPNPRGRLGPGETAECPRCGLEVPVPPPAEKPGWTHLGELGSPPSDVVFEHADQVAAETAFGNAPPPRAEDEDTKPPRTKSGRARATSERTKKLVPQNRRRPQLKPEQKRASRVLAAVAVLGALVVLGAVGVGWKLMLASNETQQTFARFTSLVEVAQASKKGGSIEEAADTYAKALDLWKNVTPPKEGEAAVSAARADAAVCADFASRTRKMAADGDATPLCELAKTCEDHEILDALIDRLAKSKDSFAAAGLVTLSESKDAEIARRATQSALQKGGPGALPLIEKILSAEDGPLQKDAIISLLGTDDKASVPVLEKALARFPKQDGFYLNAAQHLSAMKDPATVPLLKKLAHDERAQVAEAAISGLTRTAPQEAIAELVLGLDAGAELRAKCLEELAKQGDRAVPELGKALGKGQATAALPLIQIASPQAIAAIKDTLPRLSWDKRGSVLEALCSGSAPQGWLASAVGEILGEARADLAKKDERLTRTVLEQVVLAARSFGFPDAANELKFELRFKDLADRNPLPIDKNVEVVDADDPGSEPRLELKNYVEARLVLYARGPERVELHAVPNTESGRVVAPGKYDIWIARIADNGTEVEPAHGSLDLVAGKVTAIQYGTPPDPEVERVARNEKMSQTPDAKGADESESDKLKRIFDRGFRNEQLVEDAHKALAARTKDESPWPKEKESLERTEHYRVLSDAGADMAKKVGAELERAYAAYSKVLAAPADVASGGFAVRFFSRKADYDAWRSRTSFAAIFVDLLSKDRKLAERARAVADRGRDADPAAAKSLAQVADALGNADGMDQLEAENLADFEDELAKAEKATDPKFLVRCIRQALAAIQAEEFLAAAQGQSPHGTILGHYNHASRELCLFDVEGWDRTLRHEAFHQFLFAHAPKAPLWVHEGMATWFEALGNKGRNEERLNELRRANESQGILDKLHFSNVLNAERLSSLDYAISWSIIAYLIDKEPQVLAKILARAHEGKASPYGVVSAFDEYLKSEEEWLKATRALVLGN